jgi:hypothetical protein
MDRLGYPLVCRLTRLEGEMIGPHGALDLRRQLIIFPVKVTSSSKLASPKSEAELLGQMRMLEDG